MGVLNTGANLYQAGQVSSLASTQGAMLGFQIDQKLRENLRKVEIVETRRMVVKLTGILEDAIDYIPTHPSYSGVVIPISTEFAKSLDIDESYFDEVPDMELARNLKRTVRKAKSELNSIWNEEIANESVAIGTSLARGSNDSGFQESWIPDEGELIGEIYSLISNHQAVAAHFFARHIKRSGRQNLFQIEDGKSSYEIQIGPKGFVGSNFCVRLGDEVISDEKIKMRGIGGPKGSGKFKLPNGKTYQFSLKIGGVSGFAPKDAIFTNDEGTEIRVV